MVAHMASLRRAAAVCGAVCLTGAAADFANDLEQVNETSQVRASLRGFAASQSSCVASYHVNCMHNPNCCDPKTKCYAKDNAVAVCLNSCEPGIHDNDLPQFRTPWTCNLVGGGGGGAQPAPAPAPAPEHHDAPPGSCTKSYHFNCMHNPVCCSSTATCYAKDNAVAVCLESCEPGIHSNDPPQFMTPWTCNKVGSGAAPAHRPAPAPAAPAPTPAPTTPAPAGPGPAPASPAPSTPKAPSLASASSGDMMTFYMYRAQSDASYTLENINAANLAGAMWYIQNEVVSGVYGPGNKFGITRILRLKVQVKATQPLLDKGMNFGVRVAFDSGKCTGPDCDLDWSEYGFNVGCNNLGDFPFPKYDTHFADGIWYSLPGSCPSQAYLDKGSACEKSQQGGFCSSPTGSGDCTWNYEEEGELTFEELYGNMSKAEFWADPDDDKANARKVKAAKDAFAEKYGEDPPVPACDFDYDKFYS